MTTRYLAIFERANGDKFLIEYRPMYDICAGAIEILSIDITERPVTNFEQRVSDRKKQEKPWTKSQQPNSF